LMPTSSLTVLGLTLATPKPASTDSPQDSSG
jgi:hypothetical protein